MPESDPVKVRTAVPGLRWRIPSVLLVSFLIAFFDRMNISYALPQIAKSYGWSVVEVGRYGGLIMSSFYVSYGLANILLSPVAAVFGPRRSLLAIAILFSLFTTLSAPAGMIFGLFVAVRVCLGVSEAVHVPMMNVLTKKWFPVHERSRANAIWLAGLFLSMVLAPLVIVPLVEHFGWRGMFLILGGLGLAVTFPLLYFFVYDTPDSHPRLSPAEARYIEDGLEKDEEPEDLWSGFRKLLKKRTYWLILLAGTFNSMVAFGLFSWIPTYFTEGRGLAFSKLAYATSIPYLCSLVGLLFWALMGDKTNKRALIAGLGYLAAGQLTYFAATAPTIEMVIVLFCVTIFFSVTWAGNEFALLQRIVPREQIPAGVGLYNGLCMMIGGGLGPVIIGQVVAATGNYTAGILSVTAFFSIGGLVMLLLAAKVRY
ncbi:MAG: MFS transporter [Thermodesulfobacteriota bacterium]